MIKFAATIVKFDDDGVWLSPIVNGIKLCVPDKNSNVVFDGENFKIPYECRHVITHAIPQHQRCDENVGKLCGYTVVHLDNGTKYIANRVANDVGEIFNH